MNKYPFRLLSRTILLCFTIFFANHIYTQPSSGKFGVGIEFGEPSGLSLRIYQPRQMSVDILLAWDFNDFFYANIHGTWEKPISGSGDFNFFYGPGIFLGLREKSNHSFFDGNEELKLGISGTAGINYYIDRGEIYLRITPRLLLIDRTASDLVGGLGFRFYL